MNSFQKQTSKLNGMAIIIRNSKQNQLKLVLPEATMMYTWRHDSLQNNIQHNDNQHNGVITQHRRHSENSNECHFAKCRYAECRIVVILSVEFLSY
jgi:hypothetical protein